MANTIYLISLILFWEFFGNFVYSDTMSDNIDVSPQICNLIKSSLEEGRASEKNPILGILNTYSPMYLLRLVAACLATSTAIAENIIKDLGKSLQNDVKTIKQPVAETLVFIGSSQCSSVKRILGVSYEEIKGEKEPDLNRLALEYRDRSVRIVYNIDAAARMIPEARNYNPSQKLFIFLHGFTDDPSKSSFSNISDALLSQGEYNVLALDASSLIRWLYLRSTTYVRFIGERLGETIATLVHNGLDPKQVHLIGHSLGSHIAGFTAKRFTELTGQKIGRVTGLDPAGPCFSNVPEDLRLSSTDADFVDVIHTDGGVYGLKTSVGQVDYYPNGGSDQPNCLFQTCSHSRSWLYFSESVVNQKAFPAIQCSNYEAFKRGRCNVSDISYMGYPAKPGTTNGDYYLLTADDSPYSLGEDGLKYKSRDGLFGTIESHFLSF